MLSVLICSVRSPSPVESVTAIDEDDDDDKADGDLADDATAIGAVENNADAPVVEDIQHDNATVDADNIKPVTGVATAQGAPAVNQESGGAGTEAVSLGVQDGLLTGNVEADTTKVGLGQLIFSRSDPYLVVDAYARVSVRTCDYLPQPYA